MQYRAAVAGRQHSLNVNMTARNVNATRQSMYYERYVRTRATFTHLFSCCCEGKLLSNSFHSIRSSTLLLHSYYLLHSHMRHHLREIYPLWQAIMGRAANNSSSYGQPRFQKKKEKKNAKPNYESTWNVKHEGYFSSSPSFDSRSLFTIPASRVLERHPHVSGMNEWLGGQGFHPATRFII